MQQTPRQTQNQKPSKTQKSTQTNQTTTANIVITTKQQVKSYTLQPESHKQEPQTLTQTNNKSDK